MDKAKHFLQDLFQPINESGLQGYKYHSSDVEEHGLPTYTGQDDDHVSLSVPAPSALTEGDWLSNIDEQLADSDFAEDLFRNPEVIDAFANGPEYPITAPPPVIRHVVDFQMILALPEGHVEPLDSFRVAVPSFVDFPDRQVIITGCRLDPDGTGCRFSNTVVPLSVSVSAGPLTQAILRPRPSVRDDFASSLLGPGDEYGEVVNGSLIEVPSEFLAAALCTGDVVDLTGEKRGQTEHKPTCYVPRTLRTFAAMLEYAHGNTLSREELESMREVFFLHHTDEYAMPADLHDRLCTYTEKRWQRDDSTAFFLTVSRVDGRKWDPRDCGWRVSLDVSFEFCCANN